MWIFKKKKIKQVSNVNLHIVNCIYSSKVILYNTIAIIRVFVYNAFPFQDVFPKQKHDQLLQELKADDVIIIDDNL